MNLTPVSISSAATLRLENVWAYRLSQLNAQQLLTDVDSISDMSRLDLYLRQFGVPYDVFPVTSLSAGQRRDFFKSVMALYRYSGARYSVKKLVEAFGRTVEPSFGGYFWMLRHNGDEAQYDGLHSYDVGEEHKRQAFTVYITSNGDTTADDEFAINLQKAWHIFQPLKLHLQSIIFYGRSNGLPTSRQYIF